MILLHGGLANSNYWGNQVPALTSATASSSWTAAAMGAAPATPQPYGYDLMASDVIGLMDFLKIRKAAIVGWSDGAILGLDIALKHPRAADQALRLRRQLRSDRRRRHQQEHGLQRLYRARLDEYEGSRRRLPNTRLPRPDRQDVGDPAELHQGPAAAITMPTWIVDADHDEAIKRENTEFMAGGDSRRGPAADGGSQPFCLPTGSAAVQ